MSSPNIHRRLQRPRQSHTPRRSIDARHAHYEALKAGINSNTLLTQAEYVQAMRDAKRLAGV